MGRAQLLMRMFDFMHQSLGPSNWWPADSPFEVVVGAILTQNTNWGNVTKAIDALKVAGALDEQRLDSFSQEELEVLIRPCGYYRQKAGRLLNFMAFLHEYADGSITRLAGQDMDSLRKALLSVNGIGPETADSILCYALEKPVLVVDAYTARIFNRHGLVESDVDYHALQSYIMDVLPQDVSLFNEYHALLVRVGSAWCRRKAGWCESCPLQPLLES